MMRSRRDTFKWMLAAAGAGLMLGCSSPPKPPKPTIIDVKLSAAATVNPDSRNRASPVIVRIYELKAPAAFESADFFSLFDKDRETLGADMTARDEFVLQPGQTVGFKREVKSETRHLAVLVAYRDLERARWRAVAPVTLNQTQTVQVNAGARAVEMSASVVKTDK